LKLKSLAVLTVLILGCSAAFAGTYSFGFLDYTGGVEYCNYEYFATGGNGNFYMGGFDVLSPCPYTVNATAPATGLGIKVAAGDLETYGLQKGITGAGAYAYADSLLDSYYGYYTGENILTVTKTAVGPIKKNKWNWDLFVGFSGAEFLANYGFLTTTIPDATTKGHGTTAGAISKTKLAKMHAANK
jgi:hypothetical protein